MADVIYCPRCRRKLILREPTAGQVVRCSACGEPFAAGRMIVTSLHLEPLPDDDWFFQTMHEAIAENRQREDADG